jgi:hypothetical protein
MLPADSAEFRLASPTIDNVSPGRLGRIWRKFGRGCQLFGALSDVFLGTLLAVSGGGGLLGEAASGEICALGKSCASELSLGLVLFVGGVLSAVHGYRRLRRSRRARRGPA